MEENIVNNENLTNQDLSNDMSSVKVASSEKAVDEFDIPKEYKPISMWGYFGYEVLFVLPVIGLICILIFSFGGTKNVNLRNFARSQFCIIIVILLIAGLVCLVAGVDLLLRAVSQYKMH